MRQGLFEAAHFAAENVPAAGANGFEGGVGSVSRIGPLAFEIVKRDQLGALPI